MTRVWRNLTLFGAAALAAMAMIEPSFAEEAAAAPPRRGRQGSAISW